MNLEKLKSYLINHWGESSLVAILLFIIFVNFKPGFLILGNDNFSPELDPSLTLQRSLFAPAWRSYRVLGIPSDSEQADIFRTALFFVLEGIFPPWVVSQGYLFFTFFIGSFSMAQLTSLLCKRSPKENSGSQDSSAIRQSSFLMGGLFYLCSLLTSWIYFFPVALFVAAYAFLPLVLWRLYRFFENRSIRNTIFLVVASCLLAAAGLTATMFIVCSLIIIIFSFTFIFFFEKQRSLQKSFFLITAALFITLGIQAFWALPFTTYVSTNTQALRDSAINREITAITIENEARYNTALDTLRFYASWLHTRENNTDFTFQYRDWYVKSIPGIIFSFIPLVFALIGIGIIFKTKRARFFIFPLVYIAGWLLIKGINPPFGELYGFLQEQFPVFAQVFRWQSSKLWPFLATTLPILGTIGVLYIYQKLETFYPHQKVKFGFLIAAAAALLVFVFPYFKGDLVRKEVFVQVPDEYFELSKYLKSHDRFSRIYLAPEANTLYFRNYSWGFWGSVVLNYIVPNPIVEKALTIGSVENEQAFTVLTNAYYSEDPKAFTSALARYDIPLVLSDRSVSRGDVGYAYDFSVHNKVVERNTDFEKVWEKGKLALYQVKTLEKSTAVPVSIQTDFTKLNTIFSRLHDDASYYTDPKTPGVFYPFAAKFDSLEFTRDEIIGYIKYSGKPVSYSYQITPEELENSPIQLQFDQKNKALLLYPVFPYLTVNDKSYLYTVPSKQFQIKDQNGIFVSIDGQLIDLLGELDATSSDILYSSITKDSDIRVWKPIFQPFDLLNQTKALFFCNNSPVMSDVLVRLGTKTKCGSSELVVEKNTVLEVHVEVESDNPVHSLLCIESLYKKTCLNKNTSAFILGSGEYTTRIPQIIQAGDSIKVYVDFESQGGSDARIQLRKVVFNAYQLNEQAAFAKENENKAAQKFTIPFSHADNISLHIPVLEGLRSAPLRSDGILIPEASSAPFSEGFPLIGEIKIDKKGLFMTTKEGNMSMFPKLPFLSSNDGLALLGITGHHISGIPLEVNVRDVNQEYKLWRRRLFYKTPTEALDLFMVPKEVRSYYIEAFSTGIGPHPSENRIGALVFQVIPKSWYSLKLSPQSPKPMQLTLLSPDGSFETNRYSGILKSGKNTIVTIPTAVSSFWRLAIGGKNQSEKVTVNGWQQGWKIENSGEASVVFLPNYLVYIGFIPLLGVVAWLVIFYMLRKI